MPTKEDVVRWGQMLNSIVSNVDKGYQQQRFNNALKQQMQPQQSQQFVPLQQGVNGMLRPEILQSGGVMQNVQTQPNILQALNRVTTENPDLMQYASPMIQQQYQLAQAAREPWMEQAPGSTATNILTGESKTAPNKPMAVPSDKKIGERVGSDNNKYITMQRPDGTTYETKLGEERQSSQNVMGAAQGFDPDAIAKAMKDGALPPTMEGLSRGQGGVVQSKLAKMGLNFSLLNQDWKATTRHFQTLNGTQQTRLRQAAMTARESLDIIDQLADKWNGGKYPILNRANLALAKNGALGQDAQNVATQLEAQITDVVSEMSNVYMGGNSPTDQALKLAAKNLSADWSKGQLKAGTDLARKNLTIRLNSIANTGVISASGNSPYGGGQAGTPQPTPQPAQQSPSNVPTIGQIEDGYKFKGGDPSKPENWEKIP